LEADDQVTSWTLGTLAAVEFCELLFSQAHDGGDRCAEATFVLEAHDVVLRVEHGEEL